MKNTLLGFLAFTLLSSGAQAADCLLEHPIDLQTTKPLRVKYGENILVLTDAEFYEPIQHPGLQKPLPVKVSLFEVAVGDVGSPATGIGRLGVNIYQGEGLGIGNAHVYVNEPPTGSMTHQNGIRSYESKSNHDISRASFQGKDLLSVEVTETRYDETLKAVVTEVFCLKNAKVERYPSP